MRVTRTMARTIAVVVLLAAGATAAAAQGGGATAGSSPGATTTDDLLARLVTEQVEPGVHRIVNDGHRDLSRPVVGDEDDVDASAFRSNLAAGEDGSVWIFGPDEFFRLGEPGSYATDEATPAFLGRHVEVTPDGLVWALDEQAGTLRAFGEGAWAVRAEGVTDFDVAPDGTVWASGSAGLRRGGAAGWTTVDGDPSGRWCTRIHALGASGSARSSTTSSPRATTPGQRWRCWCGPHATGATRSGWRSGCARTTCRSRRSVTFPARGLPTWATRATTGP